MIVMPVQVFQLIFNGLTIIAGFLMLIMQWKAYWAHSKQIEIFEDRLSLLEEKAFSDWNIEYVGSKR